MLKRGEGFRGICKDYNSFFPLRLFLVNLGSEHGQKGYVEHLFFDIPSISQERFSENTIPYKFRAIPNISVFLRMNNLRSYFRLNRIQEWVKHDIIGDSSIKGF